MVAYEMQTGMHLFLATRANYKKNMNELQVLQTYIITLHQLQFRQL